MRFRRGMLAVGLVGLLAVVLVLAERRMPTGPDGGGGARKGFEPVAMEIQVATFNIHGCKGTDGRRDAGRIAGLLGDCDIVGLNEVHGAVWSKPQDQAAHLANLCGVSPRTSIFAPAETQWFGAKRFGNGLLTRHPLRGWQRIPLPRRYDHSCRNMLLAEIDIPQGPIAVLVTHIARSNDRERQIQLDTVLELFTSLEPPAILLADLNTPPGDTRMNRFLAETDAADVITDGGVAGRDRVDWILVRGLECLRSGRIDTDASDHPLFTAVLAIPPVPCDSIDGSTLRP